MIFFESKVLPIIVVVVAIFLRFWQLGTNPPSLTWDEVAWGYNAYTLGIDGKDEFGRFMPYDYLESFGDFKPPLYAYLTIIPIKVFGLNEFSVRFASAFFGSFTVLITYFLTKKIFYDNKNYKLVENIALFATAFLAISPWHINLSRAAFEANVASFFIVCGVWLFLRGIYEKKNNLIFSAIFFALSFYTFNSARIVSPLLVLALAVCFRKALWLQKKESLTAVLTGVFLLLPIAGFLLSPQAGLRFKEVNIFSDINVIERTNQEIENDQNVFWSKILHNRRFVYSVEYIKHYLDHFDPSFLFIKGDGNPKFSTQDVGQLYLWELPFFLLGILLIFRKRIGYWWLVPLWLIIGIVPAATARETPHALRIETALPTFQIFTAFGAIFFLKWVNETRLKKRFKMSIFFTLLFLLGLNVIYYLHGYYTHYSREFSGEWQYGYKESIEYVNKVKSNYDKIYVTTHIGRPYIYYLFYTKADPALFRNNAKIERDSFGFVHVESFDKYRFFDKMDKIERSDKNLYINVPTEVPSDAKILKNFNLLNGNIAISAYSF